MHASYSPSPTPSGSRIMPALRGLRKWSMSVELYTLPDDRGPTPWPGRASVASPPAGRRGPSRPPPKPPPRKDRGCPGKAGARTSLRLPEPVSHTLLSLPRLGDRHGAALHAGRGEAPQLLHQRRRHLDHVVDVLGGGAAAERAPDRAHGPVDRHPHRDEDVGGLHVARRAR